MPFKIAALESLETLPHLLQYIFHGGAMLGGVRIDVEASVDTIAERSHRLLHQDISIAGLVKRGLILLISIF